MGLTKMYMDVAKNYFVDKGILDRYFRKKSLQIGYLDTSSKSKKSMSSERLELVLNDDQCIVLVEDNIVNEYPMIADRMVCDYCELKNDRWFDNLIQSFKMFWKRLTMAENITKYENLYFFKPNGAIDNKFETILTMIYNNEAYRKIYIRYVGIIPFKFLIPYISVLMLREMISNHIKKKKD